MHQLCLVTDPTLPDLLTRVEDALASGITMLQLRGPNLSARELYDLALQLRPRCQYFGTTFIVNDRIDVALAVQADGIQLGHRSLPPHIARHLLADHHLLGASIHSLAEAETAITAGANFLLVGTIFPSSSHPNGPTTGPVLLHTIKQRFPACPLIAIGGITPDNAPHVISAGATGIAVISAILRSSDIPTSVHHLLHATNPCAP